jgi:hypothetical protein
LWHTSRPLLMLCMHFCFFELYTQFAAVSAEAWERKHDRG